MRKVRIPDSASYLGGEVIEESHAAPVRPDAEDLADEVLEAAVPLVVAAELRRLASCLEEPSDADKLLVRADELDPQGGTR